MRAQTVKKITQEITAGWGTDPFPIWWGNAEVKNEPQTWGRFSVQTTTRQAIALGGRFTRFLGFVWLQIFVEEGKGEVIAQKAADKLDSILMHKQFKVVDGSLTIDIQMEAGAGPEYIRTEKGRAVYRVRLEFRADGTQA